MTIRRQSVSGSWRHRLGEERGSGTVLALAVVGAILALTFALIPLLAAFAASQSAASAADSAALAAADVASGLIPGVPCEAAERAAALGGVQLDSCALDGVIATVRVSTAVAGLPIYAQARAGPPGSP